MKKFRKKKCDPGEDTTANNTADDKRAALMSVNVDTMHTSWELVEVHRERTIMHIRR
jgi:hypothetical protein